MERKGFGDKMQEKMTPNSSKSTVDKLKEGVTDTYDKGVRDLQSDSSKSTGQSMMDKASREKDSHSHSHTSTGHESILDKAKDALGMNK